MLNQILDALQPTATRLVAVSKTRLPEDLMRLYEQGQRDFGENKAQELASKHEALPKDIRWHMIGHLQSNKVKYIAPFVHLIHAVDSLKILQEIDKQALRYDRIIDCLLQFKIALEDTKYGLELSEADAILQSIDFQEFKNIKIVGVMGMATFTDDHDQVRREFQRLKEIFNIIQAKYFSNQPAFKEISMGMSDDYKIAVEEGSTMVRIGTLLFGPRL
ncbi:MAG TPA: YggS family pyridoxal phosphate-dependent enzyme [Saprospiraceae bacterium]|nr:YggS family pyridoxal phosphate-dependent enzyme [Saprospiraceae bacterium]HMP13603.1 YggS family pyridoxal phosphate-dependent enzyme [Saprospiraceae bacterium]